MPDRRCLQDRDDCSTGRCQGSHGYCEPSLRRLGRKSALLTVSSQRSADNASYTIEQSSDRVSVCSIRAVVCEVKLLTGTKVCAPIEERIERFLFQGLTARC